MVTLLPFVNVLKLTEKERNRRKNKDRRKHGRKMKQRGIKTREMRAKITSVKKVGRK
jgi:hypothetical protein